ncbi:UTP--glucose-1-phosphate uridylyltransferase [Mycolicibacterium sp. CH28]|uniref:UTP--glucose-1-phosphate uridylyltransferase n=1 Tax=Mycolicibacterium sp. CH28 TaxID=2512237 RepID=UPI0010821A86|nr:UTP--glucose-1-phosphate uridylyltransferase [Mycolicibacterium sp. CH28]TGD90636.1 UTP--glucose-1-phosphate uridylyltransferase [Mycolicibacterium sp. CH28]
MQGISVSSRNLSAAQHKMRDAGVPEQAIRVFSSFYRQLEEGSCGLIPESDITPLENITHVDHLDFDAESLRAAASATVVIKLNGGLGTTMGMDKAKSLLPVKDGLSFLDLIAHQIRHVRTELDVGLPVLFMDSFRTHRDTLDALSAYPDLRVDGLPLGFVQNREPKLTIDDLAPVTWPADPELEWCPPGHADLFTAIDTSGVLDVLIDLGYRYASVSNADNLGAYPDPAMMAWFAASGASCAAEVCRRTAADVKGGHFVIRRADGRLVLRESAQIDPDDYSVASDRSVHRYLNTNNMWFDLRALRSALDRNAGVLDLPLIRNEKNVDPSDPQSPRIIQIESAVGAAISVFDTSTAIEVERERFMPVKTTNDLALIRSDVYELRPDHRLRAVCDMLPSVDLDPQFFGLIGDFEARMATALSLCGATSLSIRGDWRIGENVTVRGNVVLDADRGQRHLLPGTELAGT